MRPFTENKIFDSLDDEFYTTGSINIGEDVKSFLGPLRDKDQIRFEFPVRHPVKMLPNSSSIYYFNVANGQWNIPAAAVKDHVGPFDKFSFNTYTATSYFGGTTFANGTKVMEDAKGFDPYGRAVASGTLETYRATSITSIASTDYNQTINAIGKTKSIDDVIDDMTDDYSKSVQRSSIYDASEDETFTFNIDKPFLLEKAVIEFPLSAGGDWFSDRTTTVSSFYSGTYNNVNPLPIPGPGLTGYQYFDRGGPAITMSLFCQKRYGTNYIRDLVLSGTITHDVDSLAEEVVVGSRDYSIGLTRNYVVEIAGGNTASFVVPTGDDNTFTGSVLIKATSAVSNGIGRIIQVSYPVHGTDSVDYFTPDTFVSWITNTRLLAREFIQLNEFDQYHASKEIFVSSIDPFGRGMTGFSPSGGSIFGKEYGTPQLGIEGVTIKNPFYIADQNVRNSAISSMSSSMEDLANYVGRPLPSSEIGSLTFVGDTNSFFTSSPSPYLVNPGDKLVLAVSKCRPAVTSSFHNVPATTNGVHKGMNQLKTALYPYGADAGHDVTLSTGSINITFYGSYVRQGSRYKT